MTDEYAQPLSADDVEVGDTGPRVTVEELEPADFVQYAGASGDFNPIHYDMSHAHESGNSDVFAQGMLTAGFGAHMVADWFGVANVTYYSARFQSRVFPGDTVTVTGEITDCDRGANGATVEADIVAKTDDEVVLSGSATADLPP